MEIMECNYEQINQIAELSKEIINNLSQDKQADFFGGVDEDEVKEAMTFPSKVFVITDKNKVIGFIILQLPNKNELSAYSKFFNVDKSMIINGYGIKPEYRKNGIALKLLQTAKEYALQNGFDSFIGTVHPDNVASKNAMRKIAKSFELKDNIIYTMKDGRKLIRERFSLNL